MKNQTIVAWALTALIGCGAPQKTEESETVQMKESAVEEIERPAERPPPRPETPPPAEPDELAVEMFEVARDRPAKTEEGLRIEMLAGAPDWKFAFTHQGQTKTVEYTGEPLYVEGVAFGRLFVISAPGDSAQVTLRSDAPSQPLPEATAIDIARKERSSRLGCEGKERVFAESNGTLVLEVPASQSAPGCRIVVGRYTGEIVDL